VARPHVCQILHIIFSTTESVEIIVSTVHKLVRETVLKIISNVARMAAEKIQLRTRKHTENVETNACIPTTPVMANVKRDSLNVENIAKRTQPIIKQITEHVGTIVYTVPNHVMELVLKTFLNVDHQDAEKTQHRTYNTIENVETIASIIPNNVMEHVQTVTLLVENLAEQTLHTT